MTTFADRLRVAIAARGPLCVGIDPHAALLTRWGLSDDVDGLVRFADTVVTALAGEVAVLKPQSAFFERHGSPGVAVLERTVAAARAAGALVLVDVKRGDIGSTAQAYAETYLGPDAPVAADALTVNPYLGFGSLRPFLDRAAATGNGVFVLALTSNPEGALVQRALVAPGRSVAGELLGYVRAENVAEIAGGAAWGSVGAVVGATVGALRTDLAEDLDCGGPLLVPGVGAQGATADDVRRLCAGVADRALPTVSRDVLAVGPDPRALRAAAARWRDQLAAALAVLPVR